MSGGSLGEEQEKSHHGSTVDHHAQGREDPQAPAVQYWASRSFKTESDAAESRPRKLRSSRKNHILETCPGQVLPPCWASVSPDAQWVRQPIHCTVRWAHTCSTLLCYFQKTHRSLGHSCSLFFICSGLRCWARVHTQHLSPAAKHGPD